MHLSTPNTPNRTIHIYQNPTKRIRFYFFEKISGVTAYSERKVVDKRLRNFVVIFIYLKERNFGEITLCGNWLTVRKIAKISALNPFVNMIDRWCSFYVDLELVVFFYFKNNCWRHHSQGSL